MTIAADAPAEKATEAPTSAPQVYSAPGTQGSVVSYKPRYDHFIGGRYVPPVEGQYFDDITPVTGRPFTEIARGTAKDIDAAVEAGWKAFPSWARTSPAERALMLTRIADRMEANLEAIA
ncbi:aldehyde dehydrogenase family protein, partial [uncultured Amnibacterium sp.]|uniref:aldehyde dehydrogenase family protein n=1 Tax=uncultured Amnibacterium sp. TaxID=1631851 RepID=UPI0035CBE028